MWELLVLTQAVNNILYIYRSRAGFRGGGQRGQFPRALRSKGAPRDDIYLF